MFSFIYVTFNVFFFCEPACICNTFKHIASQGRLSRAQNNAVGANYISFFILNLTAATFHISYEILYCLKQWTTDLCLPSPCGWWFYRLLSYVTAAISVSRQKSPSLINYSSLFIFSNPVSLLEMFSVSTVSPWNEGTGCIQDLRCRHTTALRGSLIPFLS